MININNNLKTVSLFSGAGGLDKGFIDAGFDIIWACDFDKSACLTYSKNIGNHIHNLDITQVKSEDIPDCNIIIGGSPCQGFSNANRVNTNYLENPKNLLIKEYIRIVRDKQPQIFVLENVPQLLTCGEGAFIKEIIKCLPQYKVSYKVLNCVNYGIAEERKRAIIIGCLNTYIEHPENNLNIYKTVKQAFEGLNNAIPNQLDFSKPKAETIKCMKHIPQGGNFENIPLDIRPKGNHSQKYKRLEWNKPSITITNPRKSIIIHPEENRILSIRECARIQSFEDDFIFYGSLADKQQQIANAVPPKLAYEIAKVIYKVVNTYNKNDLIA